jgi:hypothetical protein
MAGIIYFFHVPYSDTARALDEPMATQIVNDAERFVARLERYLREAGAIE